MASSTPEKAGTTWGRPEMVLTSTSGRAATKASAAAAGRKATSYPEARSRVAASEAACDSAASIQMKPWSVQESVGTSWAGRKNSRTPGVAASNGAPGPSRCTKAKADAWADPGVARGPSKSKPRAKA